MALVLIGVTILPIKDSIKVILTILILIAGAFFLVSFPDHRNWNDRWSFDNPAESADDKEPLDIDQRIFESFDTTISEVNLIFDAAAGNFRLEQTTTELFEFEREGNLGRYTYSIKDLGEKREVRIELDEGRIVKGDLKNRVAMKLNPNPVWDIKVDVGAANIEMDLSAFKINRLDINGGASSINIRLGNLQSESKIKINSGASSINIKVPEEFGCEVNTSTVLSSKDLQGFNKVSGGTYVTPDFSEKTKNIIIEVEAAVSSLNVERY